MPATPPPQTTDWNSIRAWRVQVRRALIAERLALEPAARAAAGDGARANLAARLDLTRFAVLGIYWPLRGEIDVRELARAHLRSGGRVVLPVVITKAAPVEFRRWRPGVPMERDLWKIPVPRERELLEPNALIVPLVGFDAERYRLGYGGGYYDRTLAALARRPFCIGLGLAGGRLQTIVPQPHDIAMDVIVTN